MSLLTRALIPFVKATPSWPNYSKGPTPWLPSHWGLGFQQMNLGGHKHSVQSTFQLFCKFALIWKNIKNASWFQFKVDLIGVGVQPGLQDLKVSPVVTCAAKFENDCVCCAESLSCVQLFVTPWTVACQVPLFMGILQVRILEWIAMPFSRGSSQPRDQTQVSCIAGRFFSIWATREWLS